MASREVLKILTRARKGEPEAQLAMGRLYLVGTKGVAPNSSAALSWLLEAWRKGQHGAANDIVGIPPPDVLSGEQSTSYLEACEHAAAEGSADGAFALGELHLRNEDPSKAISYFRIAAAEGHSKAALRLGLMLLARGGGEAEQARHLLQHAAEHGEAEAVAPLVAILGGKGDLAAIPWLRTLVESGSLEALDELAETLLLAGTPDAIDEARRLLSKSAQRGNPKSMWRWGRLQVRQFRPEHLKSIATHSPRRAVELLERAAQMGILDAHWDLARLYALPNSTVCDLRASRQHLDLAAEAGIPAAQVLLARRLIQRRDDPEAWIRAGRLLVNALPDPECKPMAERLLGEIADSGNDWPTDIKESQNRLLPLIAKRSPAVAARLRLAACFKLTTRETLYLDLLQIDRGWCLFADLRQHFKYRPWRLIRAQNDEQRETLRSTIDLALTSSSREGDFLKGTTRARARRLCSVLLQEMQVDPELFIFDWRPPS